MTITQDWENICEQAAMACNAQASSLFLVDRTDKSRLIQVSGSGYARGRIAEYELPDTIDSRSCPGLTPWVVKSGNVLNVKSYEELIRHPVVPISRTDPVVPIFHISRTDPVVLPLVSISVTFQGLTPLVSR